MLSNALKAIFGSRNERILKGFRRQVAAINVLEPRFQALSDDAFMARFGAWRGPYEEGTLFFYVDEYIKDASTHDQAVADKAVADCFASQDYIEGRRAFMDKRKPVWTGR